MLCSAMGQFQSGRMDASFVTLLTLAQMMQSLLLEEGSVVTIHNTSLPLGTFVKIQPQSVEFTEITDPKAVLEQALRNFSTLTEGDIISIKYNEFVYDLAVVETKPSGKGISIIETDLEVRYRILFQTEPDI